MKRTACLIFLFVALVCCLLALVQTFRRGKGQRHTQYPYIIDDIEATGIAQPKGGPRPYADIPPDRMNPFHFLDLRAGDLAYPPGIDTVAYWGNGRFNIVLDSFYDEEAGYGAILGSIRGFRYDRPVVYCRGGNGFLSVDVVQGVVKKYRRAGDIPPEERPPFQKLDDKARTDNFFIDPKTFRVTRGGQERAASGK